jgi:diadenylate cyclase
VIVQKDRISAAACFLPLTTNPAVPPNLGTRHRAAIGITEESDCLSLVVSEETGDLSVAAFGEIHRGVSLREMDERINGHFGVDKRGGPEASEPVEVPAEARTKPVEKAG